jgi:hypothetical protein
MLKISSVRRHPSTTPHSPCANLRSLSPVQSDGTGHFRTVCQTHSLGSGVKGQPALRVCRPYAIPYDRPRDQLLRSCITQLVLSCNGSPKKNPGPRPGHRGVPWGQNEWDADPKVRTLPWFRKLQNEKLCYSIQPSYSNEMQEL